MDGWKITFLLGWPIFRGHVSFRVCINRISRSKTRISKSINPKMPLVRKPVVRPRKTTTRLESSIAFSVDSFPSNHQPLESYSLDSHSCRRRFQQTHRTYSTQESKNEGFPKHKQVTSGPQVCSRGLFQIFLDLVIASG